MFSKSIKSIGLGLLLSAVALGSAGFADETTEGPSLYERLGSWDGIGQVVRDTIAFHLENPQISHYFDDVDADQLAAHVTAFFSAGTGGPAR